MLLPFRRFWVTSGLNTTMIYVHVDKTHIEQAWAVARCGTPSSSPSIKAGRPANPAADRRAAPGHPRRRARPGRTTFRPGRPAGIRPFPGRLPLQHFAARHPRRRDWVGSTARKHQANDAGGPAGHLFRTLKSRSGWCSPTPQPAPAGCSASARRPASATPRAVHTGPTPTGQIAEPQPVPARIGRQPQPRSTVRTREPTGPLRLRLVLVSAG